MSTNKIWEVFPSATEEIREKNININKIILQILFNRGLRDKNEVEYFLNADYENNISDPFLFSYAQNAIELIIKHIKEGNKIFIYGDYDADGVTSAAVLYETLNLLKADAEVYIPDRVTEGYGLNIKAIDEILETGAKLIITVDGGIRNKEEVAYAKSIGLDIIITDHHVPPEKKDLPDCLIINPLVESEKYPFKKLAGVGVAFQLARALILRSMLSNEIKQKLEENILDLVAIGTVADCVSLTGENRILVKKGLEVLNKKKRLGILELIKAANLNLDKEMDAWNIGFQIGPRLNAAGRMDHANTAFELLITKDIAEASSLAKNLNEKNSDRQKFTEDIVLEVEKQVKESDKIIIGICPVGDNAWKEGVIGLVAGRLSEKYYKPALVITKTEEGYKGSGRSIEEFNIIEAISECALFLEKYGGHPSACGFSFQEKNLEAFIAKIKKIAEEKLNNIDLRPKIIIDCAIGLNEISEELALEIKKLAPFGEDNDRPKFISKQLQIIDIMKMGLTGQHLKLKLKSDNSGMVNALGFWQAEKWDSLRAGDLIDIVYNIELNEFNGRREAQMKIIDVKAHIT